MHAVSTNQVADILHFNDKSKKKISQFSQGEFLQILKKFAYYV